ncbi:MAG TPA: nuclear transport factor 2 family protein [Rubrobacter sp.]|nr:nuclear transport factor 2 family protein [Rubrobacter sp.]
MDDRSEHLEKLGQDWAAAEGHGDTGFLARVLADDFVAVGPRGFMLTKEQWLSRHDSGNLAYESFDWDEVRVRLHGVTAVMTGRQTAEGRYEDGEVRHEIRDQFRATLVFVEDGEGWILLGLHLSPIAGPPGSQS